MELYFNFVSIVLNNKEFGVFKVDFFIFIRVFNK